MAENKFDPEREKRIRELLSRMSLKDKIGQMSACTRLTRQAVMLVRYNLWTFDAGKNKRLGIPALKFTDGPRGVVMGNSTCFPVSMARGATWDAELEERVGEAIGYEARAYGANLYGGVCINLLRHPGWGRAQETFGEDPHHLGVMGVALIKGVQKHLMACAKHFACNSIEESRFFVSVKIDERTLREIYLPHFKKCVDAGVASIMSAYNRVNGEYCGQNRHLLTEILKQEWGFDGFVESDFIWGLRDGKAGANAGLDVEMPLRRFYGRNLYKLVLRGEVSEKQIDDSALRILRQKDRFSRVGLDSYDRSKIAGKEHTALALEVARKSIVLLKNENETLPFSRNKIKTIAVIGKLANRPNIGDIGSSRVRPPYVITPLAGIKNRAGQGIEVVYDAGKNVKSAKQTAKKADAVIIVAGLTWRDEGEFLPVPFFKIGGDRLNLGLPKDQEELILEVADENKNCVVVLEGGSAVTMEKWKNKVPAILMAFYPGMEGGNAIADIIFGDFNPCAKLPIVFPKSQDQLPHFDNRAKEIEYRYYHGYRLFDKNNFEPAFPFGFGLSYTRYNYSNLRLDKKQITKSEKIVASVDVTNTGKMAGEEIVQLYIGYNGSKVDRPVKELKAFGKIALNPGETKTISLEVRAEDLAYYDVCRKTWEIEEIEYLVYVGASSRARDLLRANFKISS